MPTWIFTFLATALVSQLVSGNRGVDVVFIVDGSVRTDPRLFRQELMLIPHLINTLPFYSNEDFRFGLVTYSRRAQVQIGVGRIIDNQALIETLWHVNRMHSRETGLGLALRLTRERMLHARDPRGVKPPRRKFVVVFTSGHWILPEMTAYEARRLKRSGVEIIMVSTGRMSRNRAFQITDKIIQEKPSQFVHIDKSRIYKFIINNIHHSLEGGEGHPRTRTPARTTTTKWPPAWSTGPVTPRRSTTTTATTTTTSPSHMTSLRFSSPRPATTTVNPSSGCLNMTGEMVFIVDSSAGIGNRRNFDLLLDTIVYFLLHLPVHSKSLNITVLGFGGTASATMILNHEQIRSTYATEDLKKSIKSTRLMGGPNNAGAVLSYVDQKIFVGEAMGPRRIFMATTAVTNTGPDPVVVSHVLRRSRQVKMLTIGLLIQPGLRWAIREMTSSNINTMLLPKVEQLIDNQETLLKDICSM